MESGENKGLQEIMFDTKERVRKPLTPAVLYALKNLTNASNYEELGNLMGIKGGSAVLSMMKNPSYPHLLAKKKLVELSTNIKMPFPDLLQTICVSMLHIEDDTETKSKREAFLTGLQAASIKSGKNDFNKLVNGQLQEFKFGNGNAPFEWICEATPDTDERILLIATHCGKPLVDSKNKLSPGGKSVSARMGKSPADTKTGTENPTSPLPQKETNAPNDLRKTEPSTVGSQADAKTATENPEFTETDVPKELRLLFNRTEELQLLNAISMASQNAGETRRLKLGTCSDVFLGTVILQMLKRNYSITLSAAPTGKNIFPESALSSKKIFPKLENYPIKLTFTDDSGKSFSWKVDPGEFLSDRLDLERKKML